jgi:hypothetical protein
MADDEVMVAAAGDHSPTPISACSSSSAVAAASSSGRLHPPGPGSQHDRPSAGLCHGFAAGHSADVGVAGDEILQNVQVPPLPARQRPLEQHPGAREETPDEAGQRCRRQHARLLHVQLPVQQRRRLVGPRQSPPERAGHHPRPGRSFEIRRGAVAPSGRKNLVRRFRRPEVPPLNRNWICCWVGPAKTPKVAAGKKLHFCAHCPAGFLVETELLIHTHTTLSRSQTGLPL